MANPKGQMNTITLRSGKELEGPKCLRGKTRERFRKRMIYRRRFPLKPLVRALRLRRPRKFKLRVFHLQ